MQYLLSGGRGRRFKSSHTDQFLAYLKELSGHTNWPEESLMIDKLPLNILSAPSIKKVFPEAKFILTLRHPFDRILSCWMQNFKLNAAMADMVDLNRIVGLYCVAMNIFNLTQKRYGIHVHGIRYYDSVKDLRQRLPAS